MDKKWIPTNMILLFLIKGFDISWTKYSKDSVKLKFRSHNSVKNLPDKNRLRLEIRFSIIQRRMYNFRTNLPFFLKRQNLLKLNSVLIHTQTGQELLTWDQAEIFLLSTVTHLIRLSRTQTSSTRACKRRLSTRASERFGTCRKLSSLPFPGCFD